MSSIQPSTFEEFAHDAERGNVVPVVRTISGYSQSPIGAFSRIAGDARYAFILESVEGGDRTARYSFLGAEPEMIIRGRKDQTIIERGREIESRNIRLPDFVRDYFSTRKLARRPGLAPFAGGAVGYFAYSAARWFEPVLPSGDDPTFDDAVLMFYRTVLAFDRVRRQIDITSVVFTEEAGGNDNRLRELYDRAVGETARAEGLLLASAPPLIAICHPQRSAQHGSFSSNWTREGFQDAVRRVKEHIAAGDCYQVVLSQRFTKSVNASPIAVYRALRGINPSPYMYFLRLGKESVVGASPEMLVRCTGPRLDYRPIAGTRPRGATRAEDWLLASEMRSDEKEIAEHMMLVDLGRNDLGRVADYGSVHVEDLMSVESYSHVQHLVSSLRARLRSDLDRFDAFASCFPAGTVTGAPKVRAMEIINQLEPEARTVYAGAMLYADYSQNLDSCIAIRTIVMRAGQASVQAGAGIVADSVPESEYEESINKAKALFRAIGIAENETQQARFHHDARHR
ncbi:MAG TPA: anthranilate synthase component I family protein [Pyrinomonadaceae bacterium]|nr:anthranilate synthase component I family protein [Pyrinomonadaceae bacterium]